MNCAQNGKARKSPPFWTQCGCGRCADFEFVQAALSNRALLCSFASSTATVQAQPASRQLGNSSTQPESQISASQIRANLSTAQHSAAQAAQAAQAEYHKSAQFSAAASEQLSKISIAAQKLTAQLSNITQNRTVASQAAQQNQLSTATSRKISSAKATQHRK